MWRIFIFSWGSPSDRFHENLHFAFLCSVWGPFPGKRPKCILRLEICSLVFCLKGILAKQFHNICRISFTRSFICCRVLWHPEIYICSIFCLRCFCVSSSSFYDNCSNHISHIYCSIWVFSGHLVVAWESRMASQDPPGLTVGLLSHQHRTRAG